MAISLSYPDQTYSQANKPSNDTLKGDLQLIEDAVNASVTASSTDTLTNKTLTSPVINTPIITTPTINGTMTGTAVTALMSLLNPIGTIREFNVSTNPATLLGFGTWSAYGTGRVTIAIDAGQTEFDTVDETGGAKTANLAHTHTIADNLTSNVDWYGGTGSSGTPPGADYLIARHNHPDTGSTLSSTQSILPPYIVVYRWLRTA